MPTAEFVIKNGILIHKLKTYGIPFDVYQLGKLWFRIRHDEHGDPKITLRGHM